MAERVESGNNNSWKMMESILFALRPVAPRLRSLQSPAVEVFLREHRRYCLDGGRAALRDLVDEGLWILLSVQVPCWSALTDEGRVEKLKQLVVVDDDQVISRLMSLRMKWPGRDAFTDFSAQFLKGHEHLSCDCKDSPEIVALLVDAFIKGVEPLRLRTRLRLACLKQGISSRTKPESGEETTVVDEDGMDGRGQRDAEVEECATVDIGSEDKRLANVPDGLEQQPRSAVETIIGLASRLVQEEEQAAMLLGVRTVGVRVSGPRQLVTCFNCGGSGHMARDCRMQGRGMRGRSAVPLQRRVVNTERRVDGPKQSVVGVPRPRGAPVQPEQRQPARRGVCYSCGSPEHYADKCPQRRYDMRPRGPSIAPSRARGPTPTTPRQESLKVLNVVEEDGEPRRFVVDLVVGTNKKEVISTLIDTGATLSTIRTDVAERVSGRKIAMDVVIKTADGHTLASTTQVQTKIHVGTRSFDVSLAVLNEVTEAIILGMDVLQHPDLDLDTHRKTIEVRGEEDDIEDLQEQLHQQLAGGIEQETRKVLMDALEVCALETQEGMRQLLQKYGQLFGQLPTEGSGISPHRIVLQPDAVPSSERLRRLSPEQRHFVDEEISRLLALEIIEPSTSPWAAPLVLVRKRSGTWRMCVDYRKLNERTRKDSFPLPKMEDLFDSLAGLKYFTTLDLNSGYYQVPVDEGSKELTAFITHNGLYQFRRMPFGLCGAPATFQRGMNAILAGQEGVLVYMDDVCVGGSTPTEMLERLDRVFSILLGANLRVNAQKIELGARKVKYLGQIVSAEGREVDPERLQGIQDMQAPKSAAHLKSFLGLISFYRRYIKGLSFIANPLYQLLRKGSRFSWGSEEDEAFRQLKTALLNAPMLAHPDPRLPYVLTTDASDVGVGAVLSQNGRPVAYLSRTLTPSERNWTINDKEAFAIVWAIDKLRPYLIDGAFCVETDHKNLRFIWSCSSPRVTRWRLKLAEYNFEVKHIPGEENKVADPLSRLMSLTEEGEGAALEAAKEEIAAWIARSQLEASVDQKAIWEAEERFKKDEETGIWCCERKGSWKKVVPSADVALQFRLTALAHSHVLAGHFGVNRVVRELRQVVWWPKMKVTVSEYISQCPACQRKRRAEKHGPYFTWVENEPARRWHIDYVGPLAESKSGNKYILVMAEGFTRWVELWPTAEATAKAAVEGIWERIVCRHGVPRMLVSDNGSHFDNQLVAELCEKLGIYHHLVIPYRPQANGRVERQNQVVMNTLRAIVKDMEAWDTKLGSVAFAMNTAIASAIGQTPFRMLYGREPVTPLKMAVAGDAAMTVDEKRPEAAQYIRGLLTTLAAVHAEAVARQDSQTERLTQKYKRLKVSDLAEGDLVLRVPVRRPHKLAPRLLGPFRVVKRIGDVVVAVENLISGEEAKVHVDQLVRYNPGDQTLAEIVQEAIPHGEYVVEAVTAHRKNRGEWYFQIKWLGYGDEDNTWEPLANVGHVEVVKRYAKKRGLRLRG